MARERQKNQDIAPKSSAPASLGVAAYTGTYRDTLYGNVQVQQEDGHLVLRFLHSAQLVADLEHVHHDVFLARFRNRTFKADAWTTFNARALLGRALLGRKQYAEAEPLLLEGYQGMKQREAKTPQGSLGRMTETVGHLVQLYVAWGNEAEAARWRKELEARKAATQKPKEK